MRHSLPYSDDTEYDEPLSIYFNLPNQPLFFFSVESYKCMGIDFYEKKGEKNRERKNKRNKERIMENGSADADAVLFTKFRLAIKLLCLL